jgi:hypothetical protein
VPPGFAEDLDHEVRGAVRNLWLVGKCRGRVHEHPEPDHPPHSREITVAGRLHLSDQIETAESARGLTVLDRDVFAEAPLMTDLAAPHRELASAEHQVSRDQEGHVIGGRRGRARQLDASFAKTLLDVSGQ